MKTIPSLTGKVAVITGASRGVGAGIATLLGEQGATVYVTGRTTASKPGAIPGRISEVAESITTAGGVGIAVLCAKRRSRHPHLEARIKHMRPSNRHVLVVICFIFLL